MKKLALFCLLVLTNYCLCAQGQVSNNTTIIWDRSLSMVDRDLEKDFSILEKVFQRNKDQEVQLLLLGMQVVGKDYTIQNGNWELLKKELLSVDYDGAAIYDNLMNKAKHARVYVFTDGKKVLNNDVLGLDKNNYIINSSPDRNEEFLKRTALINRSRLMDFAAILPENIGNLKKAQPLDQLVKGTVYIDNKPAADVKVRVKGTSNSYVTDSDGSFTVKASRGDSLSVTSRANESLKLVPVTSNSEMKIFMEANTVSLDEVVVTETRQESELANTGFGKENKDKIGYAVQSVNEDAIADVNTDAANATRGKFSGVNLGQNDDLSQVTMRPSNSILGNSYGLIVVDGVPLQRSSSGAVGAASPNNTGRSGNIRENGGAPGASQDLSFLDPKNIANITVLKGLAATNRFGSEGVNGVIMITTKTGRSGGRNTGTVDQARLKDNVYSEAGEGTNTDSAIIMALKESGDAEEAYNTYQSLRTFNGDNIAFYLDAFNYFKDVDKGLATQIISNILELHSQDISKLKAVVMALGGVEAHDSAIRIYEQIIALDPGNAQAYLDIALARRSNGEYQQALTDMLALAEGGRSQNLSVNGISKTINREIRNLIFAHKNELNTAGVAQKYLNNLRYDVRMVFEWNNPESEFEIQFVNPQKRYFNWEHTNAANPERIKDEIQNGYTSEEFEFYGEGVKGKWIINAKSIGNVSSAAGDPLVLKCTLYQNFGYPNEIKEEILVHIEQPNEKRAVKILEVH